MSGWTEEGLTKAWRALSRRERDEEWRFVHLTSVGKVAIDAGCHFPLVREALIVSFPGERAVDVSRLPQGKGFDLVLIGGETVFAGRTALALVRRPEGSPDMFAVVAVDIVRSLEEGAVRGQGDHMQSFLERVREWQLFMSRAHRPLSLEAQVGLFGELWTLRLLVRTALGGDALDCWQGPLRAAQDFHVGSGAIEVKSTAGTGSFLARINSIEQLDADHTPLFLCALRFAESSEGASLPGLVAELREMFERAGKHRRFDALLMVAGYLDDHAPQYGRAFLLEKATAFRVEGDMPRLVRAQLPPAIRSAGYVLDLDALGIEGVELTDLVSELGIARNES